MHSRPGTTIRYSFALLDLIALNVSYGIILSLLDTVQNSVPYMLFSIVMNIGWIISCYGTALYISRQNSNVIFFKRSIQTFLIFLFIILFFIFFYHYSYSRLFVLLSLAMFFISITVSRILLLGEGYLRDKPGNQINVVLVGYNLVSQRFVNHFTLHKENIKIHGCFNDDNNHHFSGAGATVLGNYEGVIEYAVNNNIHEIYSFASPEQNKLIYDIAEEAEKNYIRFKYVPDFSLFINRRMYVELEKGIPILSVRPNPLEDKNNQFKKRLFDVIFSGLVFLFLLWWLIPVIALLIKLGSKGPVFFTQLRSGKKNKPFYCYKFRSLRINNDSEARQVTKNDNRFTGIGKFLRRTNLDELPQFLNVLQNTMSVIGPRPHMLKHTHEWAKIYNPYMVRHYLKPGITGWAQVSGFRGEIKNQDLLEKRIEHDIWYMENWSMWLDMRIILLSIFKTIAGDKKAV